MLYYASEKKEGFLSLTKNGDFQIRIGRSHSGLQEDELLDSQKYTRRKYHLWIAIQNNLNKKTEDYRCLCSSEHLRRTPKGIFKVSNFYRNQKRVEILEQIPGIFLYTEKSGVWYNVCQHCIKQIQKLIDDLYVSKVYNIIANSRGLFEKLYYERVTKVEKKLEEIQRDFYHKERSVENSWTEKEREYLKTIQQITQEKEELQKQLDKMTIIEKPTITKKRLEI